MKPNGEFVEALKSLQRSAELDSETDIYGWLIGSWKMRVIDIDQEGIRKESSGEWHFGRVLEGRAIQDVFIVPARDERSNKTPKEGNRYGFTVRMYDSALKAWHITWFNPVRQVECKLIGRKVGNEIIQEGKDPNGTLTRWSFRNIEPNSFRWTGEESRDDGRTWRLGAEFLGFRMQD